MSETNTPQLSDTQMEEVVERAVAPSAAPAATDIHPEDAQPLLKITDLEVTFTSSTGIVPAVRGANLTIYPGQSVAVVGESGSGKSVSCMSILRLLPENAKITGGEISFEGRDLTKLSGRELRKIRGGKIAMIFQDPMSSLNPLIRVGTQVEEMIRVHQPEKSREERRRETLELFRRVRIPEAEKRCRSFPHEFSG